LSHDRDEVRPHSSLAISRGRSSSPRRLKHTCMQRVGTRRYIGLCGPGQYLRGIASAGSGPIFSINSGQATQDAIGEIRFGAVAASVLAGIRAEQLNKGITLGDLNRSEEEIAKSATGSSTPRSRRSKLSNLPPDIGTKEASGLLQNRRPLIRRLRTAAALPVLMGCPLHPIGGHQSSNSVGRPGAAFP
jgi:hypothetical protein